MIRVADFSKFEGVLFLNSKVYKDIKSLIGGQSGKNL
jgi:hypothetical protein